MKIAIVGSGYVGLVTGTCLAEVGHQVICVDKDVNKVQRLREGEVDIYEPSLPELLQKNQQEGRLDFSSDLGDVLKKVSVLFIAVGTPADKYGNADLSCVRSVASTIGRHVDQPLLVICKSTAPVGTCSEVAAIIDSELKARKVKVAIDVVSNPEFLKEGSAVSDFMRPDRIIVGCDDERAVAPMRELYAPFNRNHDRLIVMSVRSSELTKYAANAMLATKISFINEIANIAEKVGADIEDVRQGIGSDPRIGYDFIYAGCGYGGSCFPKDVTALMGIAREYNYQPQLISAVEAVNNRQKQVLVNRLKRHFNYYLNGHVIALWGLAFKPNTNDVREAPSRLAIEQLLRAGAVIQAYDPVAMDEMRALYGHYPNFHLAESKEAALTDAQALMIFTEWKAFKVIDVELLKQRMAQPVIFDGRNLYDPAQMKAEGITYYGVGRGESIADPQEVSCSNVRNNKVQRPALLRAV